MTARQESVTAREESVTSRVMSHEETLILNTKLFISPCRKYRCRVPGGVPVGREMSAADSRGGRVGRGLSC